MAEKEKPLTFVEWVIVILASLGFAFDTYELLMLPLVLPPAIQSLGGYKFGSPEFGMWRDLMFYLPAVCGGIFVIPEKNWSYLFFSFRMSSSSPSSSSSCFRAMGSLERRKLQYGLKHYG